MMLSPVSMANVQFRGTQTNNAADILNRPGAFAKTEAPVAQEVAPKKKGGALKKTLMVAGGLLATAAALVALKKTGLVKVLDSAALTDAKWYQKGLHYLAKAGETIAKYTIDPLMNLFKKPEAVEETADAAASALRLLA